jgi:hypothetical protein
MPRPSFKPTDEQRALVKSLAAVGLPQEDICKLLELRSPKTLRKHFEQELSQGLAEATAVVARTAYEMAISGRYPAMTFFWLKCHVSCGEALDIQEEEKTSRHRSSVLIFKKPTEKEEELDAAA